MIQRGFLLPFCLAAAFAAGPASAVAQESAGMAPPGMQQAFPLDPVVSQSLKAVGAQRLEGVFSFIEPKQTPVAFANLMLYDHKALKRFMKFSKKRYAKVGVITFWEKQVMLLIVGMNEQTRRPPGVEKISKKLLDAVSELALVRATGGEKFAAEQLRGAGQ